MLHVPRDAPLRHRTRAERLVQVGARAPVGHKLAALWPDGDLDQDTIVRSGGGSGRCSERGRRDLTAVGAEAVLHVVDRRVRLNGTDMHDEIK